MHAFWGASSGYAGLFLRIRPSVTRRRADQRVTLIYSLTQNYKQIDHGI